MQPQQQCGRIWLYSSAKVESKEDIGVAGTSNHVQGQATGDKQRREQENKTSNDKVCCAFCCNGILRA